jgi:UDPglucose 6-dehydrogenase
MEMYNTKTITNISVVGLGKLGLCLAAVLADRGFNVKGIELDTTKVKAINSATSPIYEPGLDELIKRNVHRLKATSDYSEGIEGTDATFVVVPTPSEEDGSFSLKFVLPAINSIGEVLKKKEGYHLVVITSTVGPGSTDNVIKPLLESASGKVCGEELGLCYNPEFIALGDVIHGLLKPDFVLIGESDGRAGDVLSSIQKKVCLNDPPIERMEFVNAELAKIAVNSFVTMKMSFANTLAEICERLPKGDVDKVTKAIGRDRRIGSAYLKGALGYGGPCFPRDNIAFNRYAESVGSQAVLATSTHKVNTMQVERMIRLALKNGLHASMKVGILGLSYKPNTNVVEESQALQLASSLVDRGHSVFVFDPAAMDSARKVLGDRVKYANSALELVSMSDYIILATPWNEFANLPVEAFSGKHVLDCWRFLPSRIADVATYSAVGRSNEHRSDSMLSVENMNSSSSV